MPNLKVVDLNPTLIRDVKGLGYDAKWHDYFEESKNMPNAVLITASNPRWTFGGGIDAIFYKKFKKLCQEKQEKGGGMERIDNIVFAITVDENYDATPQIIKEAIEFALSTLKENETLVLSGIGTGIGGLSTADFCAVLKSLKPKTK